VLVALSFATEAAGVLGKIPDPAWAEVASGLSLEVQPVVPNHPGLKGGYHPEYKVRPARWLATIRLRIDRFMARAW
jgi:hypothetical protein